MRALAKIYPTGRLYSLDGISPEKLKEIQTGLDELSGKNSIVYIKKDDEVSIKMTSNGMKDFERRRYHARNMLKGKHNV